MTANQRYYYEEILPHIKSDIKCRSESSREELGRDGEYWLFDRAGDSEMVEFYLNRLRKRFGNQYEVSFEQPDQRNGDLDWALVLRKK